MIMLNMELLGRLPADELDDLCAALNVRK